MTTVRKIRDEVLAFHRDQRGESSTLSNVMMLAVAAIAVVALIAFGKTAFEWLKKKWGEISGSSMG
jgi:hypothetical protein